MLARLLACSLAGLFLILILIPTPALAEQAGPAGDLLKIPIREITIFKDGHAFVLHEGKMPTDQGRRRRARLPTEARPGNVLGVLVREGRTAQGRHSQ